MSASVAATFEPSFAPDVRETYIGGKHRWFSFDLASVWQFRELLLLMVWRDIKVRYKQTALGVLWAVLQPLSIAVVFTLFFGRMVNIASEGIPASLYVFTGILPWTFATNGLVTAANSLVGNASLINKVYFPRVLAPLSCILSGLVDFSLGMVVMFALMAWNGILPGPTILGLIVPTVLAFMVALGTGLWLSALNVKYRDVRHTVPFLTQLWMFSSPIFYSRSSIAEKWQCLYTLNPMTGVIEGFRWAVLGRPVSPYVLVSSFLVSSILVFTGMVYFRYTERRFADLI